MLNDLRDRTGRPNLRARLIAALVVVGLFMLTAPTVLVPMIRALWNALMF